MIFCISPPIPKSSAKDPLHTWAQLPPPTIAHGQHLHIFKLQGGVGWVQSGTVVSHIHVDEGFRESHSPLPTPQPPVLPCPGCHPNPWAEPQPPSPPSPCLLPGPFSAFLCFKLSSGRLSLASWPSLCRGWRLRGEGWELMVNHPRCWVG